ncbi:MAG: TonB-dependent receptor [Isosphaeraceae bacterium]
MQSNRLDTHQKALQINLDNTKYGTFAEIGAGQEVARWFFRVGGAAGTIAKSISAYDMTVSDAIYGATGRYVSRQRLETMLDYEYRLMTERLASKRGENTRFFTFADTVAAMSYTRRDNCHGWMGIRFQPCPGCDPSQIILHVSLLDRENLAQQEAMGILGVNLIHSALYHAAEPEVLIKALLDDLSGERIEVDLIEFSGPAFAQVDNRLMSLELVHCGLSSAAMFRPDGKVIQPAEAFYKKPILLMRGSFRPVTNVTVDMLNCALARFVQEPANQDQEILVVTEMSLNNLLEGDTIDNRDFLDRVDILGTLGRPVLITNFGEFYRLANYLQRHTSQLIGLVMGVPTLREIFEEKYYTQLAGGILESFGRLFKNDLKLYVYPLQEPATGALITASNLRVAPKLQHLYNYLIENQHIQPIRDYNPEILGVFSRDVYRRMRDNDPSWVHDVPPGVALMICQRHLLGYQTSPSDAAASPNAAETSAS